MSVKTATLSRAAHRNIETGFAFTRAALNDPSILDHVPNGAHLVLMADDDTPEQAEWAVQRGLEAVRRGENVYFCHVHREADGTLTIRRHSEIPDASR